MATETIKITANPRAPGKGNNRQARTQKLVPGVVYGPKFASKDILVDELSISRYGIKRYESTLFELNSEAGDLNKVKFLFKDVQWHPVSHRPIHIDLYVPDMTQSIRVNVEIILDGEPIGVKNSGGLLNQSLREIEVECSPDKIPENFHVDVSGLDLHQSLHISDLSLPAGVKAITSPERTIASVTPPKEEKAEGAGEVGQETATEAAKSGEKSE